METANPTHSNRSSRVGLSPETAKWLAAGSALIAIGVHAYLLKTHYELRYGEVVGQSMCDISARFSCSAASASRWSEFLGVPMALWGILTNLAYLGLFGWNFISDDSSQNINRSHLLTISGVLGGASIVMAALSVFTLATLCPFCLATYVLSALTAIGAWLAYRPGLKFTVKPSLFGIAAVFALAGFILNDQFRSGFEGDAGGINSQKMAQAALEEWKANPTVDIKETDPLAKGPSRSEAKMTIVEFADFRCIHCKMASAPIKAFVAGHSDVRLEYYSWPLDGECNTSIKQNNGASCLLARMVWCARHKGEKGWEAHETAFARFEDWRTAEAVRTSIEGVAQAIGVDAKELVACSDSQEAKDAIQAQAQLGNTLNIKGTPTIYVNGRLLPAGSSIPVLNAVHGSL